jgi:DNA segregation ATPase FtsK/SpoIIIE, S-DNA-T family
MARSLAAREFLPDEIGAAIRRRIREIGGVALIALSAATAVALATWSVNDPSLSHATSVPARNLLGLTGAIVADLMMQLLGLASVALLMPVAGWGWRLVTHRRLDREAWRVLLWIVGVLAAAGFASCLPKTGKWPLPSGLGGVLGDALLRLPAGLLGGPLAGLSRFTIAIVLATAALSALVVAAGFGFGKSRADDDEPELEGNEEAADGEERASISLGWLVHALLSLKARLMRLLAWPFARWQSARGAGALSRARLEPQFAGASPAPVIDQDEGAEAEEEGEEEEAGEEAEVPVTVTPQRKPARSASPPARKSGGGFTLPALGLLAAPRASDRAAPSIEMIQQNATALESVLQDFGVRGEIINARPGPVVTLYELEPAPGIKSSRVIGLADDIARSMSALSARVAVVSGRNAIGIELPNPTREKVYLRELLAGDDYTSSKAKLPLCLGKGIGGESIIVDLTRMPHLLIAGTTGSGKSVAINTMILSLVYQLRPDQCRLVMIDPKMLELSVYDGIPHLLTPVVTDPKKAVVALKWAVREMEERYKKMSKLGVRNIDGYNARVAEAKGKGETLSRTVQTGFDRETGEAMYEKEEFDLETLPFVVVIVDEMADLMMVAGKDIEGAIQRLAQMARAAGIHVILATQRPSVDVITGTIKANFPTRVSFQVTSKIDSRTILGEQGAEQLLGQGDMLYMAGGGRISRVHGPFVSDEEVEKVVRHLKAQGAPQYLDAVTAIDDEEGEDGAVFDSSGMAQSAGADLYSQAVQVVLRDRKASTSYIQRRLQIGYNRAASLMERMELEGVVGQANHAGKREILVGEEGDQRY